MKYTKRSLNTIVIVLTVLIFILVYLIVMYFLQLFNFNSKKIYSQVIPNELNNLKNQSYLYNPYQIASNLKFFDGSEAEGLKSNVNNDVEQKDKEKNNNPNYKYEDKINKIIKNDIDKTEREVINENKHNSWRIKIPKLNLDAHISEGIEKDTLLKAVGHFENSSRWEGNICLAAHNRGYKCNFFKDAEKLKVGDEIIYSINGKKKIYKVTQNKIISEKDWRDLDNKKKNCITLITCVENREEFRRCIQGNAVSENVI